jgi:hypothetical protein
MATTTSTATYAELLKEVSVTVTPNDAVFLAQLLYGWMRDNNVETPHLRDLAKHLNVKAGC